MNMVLRITLHEGDETLLDLPLTGSKWKSSTKERIMKELDDSETDLDALCEICDFFSNKRRVQMLNHMVRNCNNLASFTDLLKVGVNPKYVSDLVNRSSRRELVVKDGRGYSLSPLGLGSFLLLSLGTRRLVRESDSTNDDDKSFEGQ